MRKKGGRKGCFRSDDGYEVLDEQKVLYSLHLDFFWFRINVPLKSDCHRPDGEQRLILLITFNAFVFVFRIFFHSTHNRIPSWSYLTFWLWGCGLVHILWQGLDAMQSLEFLVRLIEPDFPPHHVQPLVLTLKISLKIKQDRCGRRHRGD